MSGLKIEAGKHYRLRDGSKCLCYAVYPDQVHSVVLDDERGLWMLALSTQGRYNDSSGAENPRDIVEEWSEK